MSHHATMKELEHARGVDTFDLTAKKDITALKAEVDKLDTINWLMFQIVSII